MHLGYLCKEKKKSPLFLTAVFLFQPMKTSVKPLQTWLEYNCSSLQLFSAPEPPWLYLMLEVFSDV